MVWHGINVEVNLELISHVTRIPISPVNLPTEDLGHYLPHMGLNCSIASDVGLRGTTMYENVYIACRWVQNNILEGSHISLFYISTFHIVYMMMTRDSRICLCYRLFDSIAHVKRTRRKTTLPLAILIIDRVKIFL